MKPEISDISDEEIESQQIQYEMFCDHSRTASNANFDTIKTALLDKWKNSGFDVIKSGRCPIEVNPYCAIMCEVSFENICYFTQIGQLKFISKNSIQSRFGVSDPRYLISNPEDKNGFPDNWLLANHLDEFIKISVEIMARLASSSLSLWHGNNKRFFPKNMIEFEEGVVQFLIECGHIKTERILS